MSDFDVSDDWGCKDAIVGITLSVSESIALWGFFQRDDCPPYWLDPEIASLAEKAKSFHKYGPWDSEPPEAVPDTEEKKGGDAS